MKLFVLWTGVLSVLAGAGLQFTAVSGQLMPAEQPGMLVHLFGLMAAFLGAIYLFGLPRHLRVSLADLLLDRQASERRAG